MMRRGVRPLLFSSILLVPLVALAASKKDGAPKISIPTEGWIECSSEHFTIYSNAGEQRTSRVAVELERFRQALGRITRGFKLDAQVPSSTFLFKNDAQYTPYKQDESGNTKNVSGYFLPRPFHNYITLDANAGSQPMSVVFHEYFHAVMDASIGDLPLWLNEGLAEYYSTFRQRNSEEVEVGHPIEGHMYTLAQTTHLPWEDVFATTHDSPNYNESTRQGAFYAQSWLLVHYLFATQERTAQLGRYLTLLRSEADETEAFGTAFGIAPTALGRHVDAYADRGSNYVWFDFGEEFGEVAVTTRELPPAELLYRLGDLLAQSGNRAAADLHLEEAAKAGWPAAQVLAARAAAAFYADEKEDALALVRSAVAAGNAEEEPNVLLEWLLFPELYETAGKPGGDEATSAMVAEIRSALERALGTQPDSFHALTGLARTYVLGEGDVAPGLAAIERARALRPLELDMLQVQAALLARAGQVKRALALIEEDISPKDAETAERALDYAVYSVLRSASQHASDDEHDRGIALLDEALATITDLEARKQLVQMRNVLTSGGRIVDVDTTEGEVPAGTIDAYNRAVELATRGNYPEAVQKLQELEPNCGSEQICSMVREMKAQLEQTLRARAFVDRYNQAVTFANGGDTKKAIEVLRELETSDLDDESRQAVQSLLRSLGARRAKGG